MEIRHFYIYIFSFVLIKTYLEAKPVSLNDIIAAEEQAALSTTSKSAKRKTLTGTHIQTQTKKSSPLKFRQTFQIESPSLPKKFKTSQKSRYKRKYLTKKREINDNDGIIQKYIPLLKNLRLLVDNILASGSSETYEPREKKFKRNHSTVNERASVACTCERKSDSDSTSRPQEKTIKTTTALTTEIPNEIVTATIATTTPAFTSINDNVRRIGWNKNVPVLSTRNSTSVWRNDSGFGQRRSSSFNGSIEGYIPRNNGNNECDTRDETWPHTENYEEYTNSYPRNDAGRDGSSERVHGFGIESRDTELNRGTSKIEESALPGNKTFEDDTRYLLEHKREMEYKIRRDETESSISIPELASRLRGFDSQEKVTAIRTTETNKEAFIQNSTSDKQFPYRNGPFTAENQEVRTAHKAIGPKHILPNSTYPVGKVVMIFDGYSVAKDVNGDNKLTEKAIHIHKSGS
ncbi:uncharacterized protein LOC120626244 [Pararge aegeria]|uniref:uncharacterized protein LOC120626244 n=1 Tax=Pararge aegeria TaxID=116150 RepID=UPI0019D19764|nr:uncharacterized protein LOC120626244 [Pararge aegeria]